MDGGHEAERPSDSPLSPERRAELEKASAEALGREALEKIGYARLLELSRQAGFVTTQKVTRTAPAAPGVLAMGGAVPVDEAIEVFTKYAVAAGVTSQVDSPLPGPADVAAVGILVIGLLHVGGLVTEELVAGSSSPPVTTTTTAPPPVPPLAMTAAPTTTVVVPPIALTRRNPGQTCDDARLDELERQKNAACKTAAWSCSSDKVEKIGRKREKLLTCPELLARESIGRACHAARLRVQTECFAGSPDAGHQKAIQEAEAAFNECDKKAKDRGCK